MEGSSEARQRLTVSGSPFRQGRGQGTAGRGALERVVPTRCFEGPSSLGPWNYKTLSYQCQVRFRGGEQSRHNGLKSVCLCDFKNNWMCKNLRLVLVGF